MRTRLETIHRIFRKGEVQGARGWPFAHLRGLEAEGTKMMMNFFSVFSSKAVQPQSARPSESPRNWRCQLGTFWQDIEEAGSVLKARRLVPSEVRVQRTGGIDRAAGRHGD